MSDLWMIFDHLRHFRMRAFLILTTVALAFFAFGVLGALRYSLNSGEADVSESRLIITHRNGILETLPLVGVDRIQEVEGLGTVGHATWMGHFFQTRDNILMSLAVDTNTWLVQHPDMILTQDEVDSFLRTRDGLLVSRALARKFGWSVGDRVPLQSIIYPGPDAGAWTYTVSGIFTSDEAGGGRNYLVSHYAYLNENRTVWKNMVGTYIATPAAGVPPDVLGRRIDALFETSTHPTSSQTDRAFHNAFFAQFGDIVTLVRSVIGVNFTALIIIVSSSMALSVRQLSRDIGVLRVIGFSNGRIMRLFLGMITFLVLTGAIMGLSGAAAFNRWITNYLPQVIPDVVMPMPVIGEAAGIALLLALLTALIPVIVAVRIRPLDVFKVEAA